MSFFASKPYITERYDNIEGENRNILKLKPGLTSETSIKYRDEELLLQNLHHPKQYNDEVLFLDKVKMNLVYYYHHNLLMDLKIILKTVFSKS